MTQKAQQLISQQTDQLLSKRKVARLLDVSTRTVDRMVQKKLLAKVYIGATVRFRLSEVRALAGI